MSTKVVTLGEVMLRLSPPDHQRFIQANKFDFTFGGGEVNVAVALCNYGLNGTFVTKVPQSPIGQMAINRLREYGVDTHFIVRGGNRLGIYYFESGASIRSPQVIYDRKNSAVTDAEPGDFNFDAIFDGASWFHTSGITPALSDKAAAITEVALKKAKEKGITTSLDLNYRKSLWSKDDARRVLSRLCQYVDVLIGAYIGNEALAETTLGFKSQEKAASYRQPNIRRHKDIFKQMRDCFHFKYIASTFREVYSASDHRLSALVYNGAEFYISKKYAIRVVDRIGGGDSFASGLIYALLSGMDVKETAEFAIAASALKHTFPGDFNHATTLEVKALIEDNRQGKECIDG